MFRLLRCVILDKDASQLTLSECAVIAGITQNPTEFDPVIYPDNNSKRRATKF